MASLIAAAAAADPFMPHGACYLWRQDLVWLHVASDSLEAVVDPEKCGRILTNLLSNALKFTPRRAGPCSGWSCRCQLRETERTKPISPPRQETPDAEGGRGSGVGLQMARDLVRQMDGAVEVESGEGGTRFTIIFPLTEDGT